MQQTDAIKQFRLAIIALTALVVLGTFGYHILMNWNLLDCLYMTIITLGAVGFKEVGELDANGKVFTIVLIVFGLSTVFWAGASLIEAVIGEQVWHAFQRRRMQKQILNLKGHYIICGFGRMGQQIVRDLQRENKPFVVIEQNPEQLPKLIEDNIPFVEGNASDNEALLAAGIKNASGLITVAPTDEDNVFITLSARALNKDLFIVARSILIDNEDKLKMAGANRVMSPYVMGGKRMSQAVLRPNVLDFLELAMHTDELQMMIEEVSISQSSCMVGKTLEKCGLNMFSGITVIALKRKDCSIIPNPTPDIILESGDILIVLGTLASLEEAERASCQIS